MLERYAVKVARTVLRGGSGSNATPLPDQRANTKTGWLDGFAVPAPVQISREESHGTRRNTPSGRKSVGRLRV
jgi:hypothetical protein